MRRPVVPILIAGIALIASACSDGIAPPRSDDASALRRVGGPLSAAKNGYVAPKATYVQVTIPAAGGVVHAGPFSVFFPANAVCDRATTRYGKAAWDDACNPIRSNVHLTAAYWEENGMPFVEFLADLRFDPRKFVVLRVVVPGLVGSDGPEIEYWSRTQNGRTLVNEGRSDASMRTFFDARNGTIYRRIKHFSGYVVTSGRCEEGDPNCAPE